ncbi:alpha/beta hydrolase [Sphingobium sufflavum]|uniref:alpha/beta hydrolase n=1 Tax=Sphingobium sufflavum TaxID=1129547 RepID=UPI001F3791EA|nr:alpha/beta hydrolase [Sphingobium sufflavum]MCE7795841.1 alpha/beta hydrolase [Sphingobium sufflavum]
MPQIRQKDVRIDTPSGTPVPLRIYEPWEAQADPQAGLGGALLWIHGGGYVISGPAQDDAFCIAVAREQGLVVVSVDYRLAPEHPFPAPLVDCHSAWTWMQAQAVALGIDPARIAIGGQSAGGGLAAALVQQVHDEGGPQPVAQWLFCPMIDDRTAARIDLDQIGHRLWSNRNNRTGWEAYLGREPGAVDPPPYAAAARRTDLAGLPPAWIGVGTVDLFCEEDRVFADRLREADVDVTFRLVDGAPHGFESWASGTDIAQAYLVEARAWLYERLVVQSPATAGVDEQLQSRLAIHLLQSNRGALLCVAPPPTGGYSQHFRG